ncbi:MAG: nucleotidyltransferase domain-containing protein [Nitrospirota bacterium]|nr:nucleotidyltransferase domain-containing protein [Nitrospirota bacterium]
MDIDPIRKKAPRCRRGKKYIARPVRNQISFNHYACIDPIISNGVDIETIKHKAKREIRKEKLPIVLTYLYGSVAKGKEKESSDIDIAILLKEDEYSDDPLSVFGSVQGLARRIERQIKKEVDIHILNRASLSFSYIVVTTGIPIYISSKMALHRYQNKILGMFFDFKPFFERYLTVYGRV